MLIDTTAVLAGGAGQSHEQCDLECITRPLCVVVVVKVVGAVA